MSLPYWRPKDTPAGSLWDYLWLGGGLVPGLCADFDISKERSIDQAKQKGTDGITLTDNGYEGAPCKATQILWTPQQWLDFTDWLPNYDPQRPGGSRTPLDIVHPAAALLAVRSVYLKKIHTSNPIKGILRVDFEMVQWFPSTATAKSKPAAKGFDGTNNKNGAVLNPDDFKVPSPAADTGSKL
jgi:hypothetical protein